MSSRIPIKVQRFVLLAGRTPKNRLTIDNQITIRHPRLLCCSAQANAINVLSGRERRNRISSTLRQMKRSSTDCKRSDWLKCKYDYITDIDAAVTTKG